MDSREFENRRTDLVTWINSRWKTDSSQRAAAEKKLLRVQAKLDGLVKQLEADGVNVDELLASFGRDHRESCPVGHTFPG